MARALAAASVPVFIALSPGGYHSGYHTLMAMPHCAMAQPGSAAATAVNCFAASSYQNEWSTAKARSNRCCASAEQEIGKWTLPAWRSDAVSAVAVDPAQVIRSEEHTSELQSHVNLVC